MQTKSTHKSNKQFMILSAIGILFVVDAHAWSPLGILIDYFPYNSFFMPMFCFISGYFFKSSSLDSPLKTIARKAKTLLFPYFLWNLFYTCFVSLLRNLGAIAYGKPLSIYSLFLQPFLDASANELTTPAWFVPALFLVIVIYIGFRKVFNKLWNHLIATLLFISIGTFCVYLSRKGYYHNLFLLPALKTGFLIQFYQLGNFYHESIEKHLKKIPSVVILVSTLLINALLTYLSQGQLYFNSLSTMSGFLTDFYFLPLITSVTGILFWLTVSDILSLSLGESKLVNYVSNNTYTVMMHHMLFFNVYNLILYTYNKYFGIISGFDANAFRSTGSYRYEPSPVMRIFYVVFGFFGPLITKYLYHWIKNKYFPNSVSLSDK